jgi:hypothetical protein
MAEGHGPAATTAALLAGETTKSTAHWLGAAVPILILCFGDASRPVSHRTCATAERWPKSSSRLRSLWKSTPLSWTACRKHTTGGPTTPQGVSWLYVWKSASVLRQSCQHSPSAPASQTVMPIPHLVRTKDKDSNSYTGSWRSAPHEIHIFCRIS